MYSLFAYKKRRNMQNESLMLDIQMFMAGLFERFKMTIFPISFTKNLDNLKSVTNICTVDFDKRIIFVNDLFDYSVNPPFLLFCLAHEVRHIYQWKQSKGEFRNDYVMPSGDDSEELMEEYRLQDEEVDANAFAFLEINRLYGSINLDYGPKVMAKVNERMSWIEENESFLFDKNLLAYIDEENRKFLTAHS